MGIILIFASIGWLVGFMIGAEAASSIDPTAVGGQAVKDYYWNQIVFMDGGRGAAVGVVVGLIAWVIVEAIREDRYQSRRGVWSELAPSSPSDAAETLDSMASRMAARREAIAAGVSAEDFDRGLAEALRIDEELEEQAYRKRMQDVGFNLRWPEG